MRAAVEDPDRKAPGRERPEAAAAKAFKGFGMLPNKRGSMDVDSHVHCLPGACVATNALLAGSIELSKNCREPDKT